MTRDRRPERKKNQTGAKCTQAGQRSGPADTELQRVGIAHQLPSLVRLGRGQTFIRGEAGSDAPAAAPVGVVLQWGQR
jgi:hypothetical protein